MRVPMSWVREFVQPEVDGRPANGREVAEALINTGLEVETVDVVGADVTGPLVVGLVLGIEELTEFKKPIRFCRVRVGAGNGETVDGVVTDERGIICGARNFSEGDLVVVALPGAVLPGGFAIGTRQTYGRTSDGMICSERELAIGDDHGGIMVIEPGTAEPGDSGYDLLGIGDEVLDIAVTPDRGYALSIRGVAREVAQAFSASFDDPALVDASSVLPASRAAGSAPNGSVQVCGIDSPDVSRFVMRTVEGFDPAAPSPRWMRQRLTACGMRPVSLAVDVTNYVMLELGQPLHAFDRDRLQGAVVARAAKPGEKLETLDHVKRILGTDDLVITDDRGPIGLAGTMGGLDTEIDETTTSIAVEAAHFDSVAVARMSRKHKLSSEASRRFERGVDPALPEIASARAVAMLVQFGGGTYVGTHEAGSTSAGALVRLDSGLAARTAGLPIDEATVVSRLEAVGCSISGSGTLEVVAPTWRPDLVDPAGLVEEVIRLGGYDSLPSTMPRAQAGRGLSRRQQLRRQVSRALAAAGLIEVLNYPFVGGRDFDELALAADDPRRNALRLANPLSDEQPALRTTLLSGLLAAARRNVGRGQRDIAISEMGTVFILRPGQSATGPTDPPRPGVSARPSDAEIDGLNELLPSQPLHAAGVLAGDLEPAGWWGPARPATWAEAVGAVRAVAAELGVELAVAKGSVLPWHPGRCAEFSIEGEVVGHAGELHPKVVELQGLPARTCAFEVDLDALIAHARTVPPAPVVGTFPVAKEDVAIVVDGSVAAQAAQDALRAGAGELLESIRLFDVYTGSQVGEGRKSLAFALRFRAEGRTLSADEVAAARDAAVRSAVERVGAVQRA